jgi:threonine/homoserine/homoserine lactone efflux protein
MFRSIAGFAVLAVLVWLGLKIVFAVLGGLFGLAMTVLWLAGLGFLCYLVLRVVSPSTADKVREMIKGRPADA